MLNALSFRLSGFVPQTDPCGTVRLRAGISAAVLPELGLAMTRSLNSIDNVSNRFNDELSTAALPEQRAKGTPRDRPCPAFKWIRVLFRCWKKGKPCCEEAYRQTLARRQHLSGPVQLQWKTCSGFSKIDLVGP